MTKETLCIKCPHAAFLDPRKEICYKTGGLFCKRMRAVVGKYDTCRMPAAGGGRDKAPNKPKRA